MSAEGAPVAIGARPDAMEVAGRLLAVRARTAREMVERLESAGFDPEAARAAVARLEELGLIDDEAFARRWVEERAARKGLSGRTLVEELVARGVDRETARAAVDELAVEEDARATEVASRLVGRVAALPLHVQAARLQQRLMRRGYSWETADAAVRAVLPPEGWD